MALFSHVARTAALAASLALSGAAMAKSPSAGGFLAATSGSTFASQRAGEPLALSVVNVAGIGSFEGDNSPANTVITLLLAPNAQITGIGWNVIISAFNPSWLSEMVVSFVNSDQSAGVDLKVASGDTFSGLNAAYTSGGVLSLIPLGLNFNVNADGILRIEFFESFDDDEVNPDGRWVSGNLTIDVAGVVPEPSTYGLMALGLLGVAGVVRRRTA